MTAPTHRTGVRPVTRGAAAVAALLTVATLSACSSVARPTASDVPVVSGKPTPAAGGAADSAPTTTAAVPVTGSTTGPAESSASSPSADSPVATDTPQPQATTDVVLSFLGWNPKTTAVEAGGYISPVVESGGRCTLELTQGTRAVTVSAPAEPDATTTACGNLSAARSRLTPGRWTAVLRYASTKTTGVSDSSTVDVP